MFLHMSFEIESPMCAEGAAEGEALEGFFGF